MEFPVKRVMVMGGTGFIGYHACFAFLKKGVTVGSVSIADIQTDTWFPREIIVDVDPFNVFTATEQNIRTLLLSYDTLVYALGPDDREMPAGPPYAFFHEKLVLQCVKVMKCARAAGIRRVVVLNSYFGWFDRQPEFSGRLSKDHPYIRARVEQAMACIAEGEAGAMEVMILELPYIFGTMPGRIPIWKSVFLDRFAKLPAIFFPGGGTVAIHVKGVAEAIVAAAFNGKHGTRYPIGDANLKYRDIFRKMYEAADIRKKVVILPPAIAKITGVYMEIFNFVLRRRSGLNIGKVMGDMLTRDLYFSEETITRVRLELGYESLGYPQSPSVEEGIIEAAMACFNHMK
jgi:dihydroflavonol-4-reductase